MTLDCCLPKKGEAIMGGLDDPLRGQSDEHGITTLDLIDLPPVLYRVMRLMLRRGQMTYPQLDEANAALSDTERLSRDELDAALQTLVEQGWLVPSNEEPALTYKVSLRRKVRTGLDTFSKRNAASSALTKNIWDALDSNVEQDTADGDHS
jgi:hypothetical protein